MAAKKQVPIIEGLFTWPSDKPQLVASRCKKCGTVTFPKAAFCANPNCQKARENVEQIKLSNRGKLWTWTIQQYAPPAPFRKEPLPFQPYGIGMVDTEEGLRVLGILTSISSSFTFFPGYLFLYFLNVSRRSAKGIDESSSLGFSPCTT